LSTPTDQQKGRALIVGGALVALLITGLGETPNMINKIAIGSAVLAGSILLYQLIKWYWKWLDTRKREEKKGRRGEKS
jgi:hypothetical protein